MIFKKILKGTDLALDLSLEKRDYTPGEIVRGTLSISTEKGSKARKLILLAEGKEFTSITVTENTGIGSRRDTTSRTYSETNVFFSKDLSNLLQQSVTKNILQDGALEILPQSKVMAFDFTLPADDNTLFSSYKGKHANITYTIKGTIDIANKLDVNEEERFSVINPKNRTVEYNSVNSSSNGEDKGDATNPVRTENSENILPSTTSGSEEKDVDKGNYEAKFERMFGKKANPTPSKSRPHYLRSTGRGMSFDLETIFTKGREDFLEENNEARIDLIDQSNSRASYSPGHTIRGKVMPWLPRSEEEEEDEFRMKIRGMKITLSGIEHAYAQGLQRLSTIEKYDKTIEMNGNQIEGDNHNNAIPFEFDIPQGLSQSYIGKYSEYFWGLEAKVNIAWSSDLVAKK